MSTEVFFRLLSTELRSIPGLSLSLLVVNWSGGGIFLSFLIADGRPKVTDLLFPSKRFFLNLESDFNLILSIYLRLF